MTSLSVARAGGDDTTTTTTITGSPAATAKVNQAKEAEEDADVAGAGADAGKYSEQLEYDLTAYFHTTELAGLNQDVIPIVVETQIERPRHAPSRHRPRTDGELHLELLRAGAQPQLFSDSTPKTTAPEQQQAVALGVDGFLVTPHSRSS